MLVVAWGWEDIEDHVSQYEDACNAFDPTYSPYVKKTFEKIEILLQQSTDQLKNEFRAASMPPTGITDDTDAENTPLHGKISTLTNLIDDGHVQLALTQLDKIKSAEWATASRSERYRILMAIAVARVKEGNYKAAGKLLLDAYSECPERKKAKQTLAKGYFLNDEYEHEYWTPTSLAQA